MACRLDFFFNQRGNYKHRDELFDGIYSENTEESYVGTSIPHSSQLLCMIHVYGLNFFQASFLNSAVHIYDFQMFIISSLSFHGFITNQFNDLLQVGLLA